MTTPETTVDAIRIYRYSWWASKDGLREFVVVEIIYDKDPKIPDSFRIKEKAKPIPYEVPAKDWMNNVQSGKIIQIV